MMLSINSSRFCRFCCSRSLRRAARLASRLLTPSARIGTPAALRHIRLVQSDCVLKETPFPVPASQPVVAFAGLCWSQPAFTFACFRSLSIAFHCFPWLSIACVIYNHPPIVPQLIFKKQKSDFKLALSIFYFPFLCASARTELH